MKNRFLLSIASASALVAAPSILQAQTVPCKANCNIEVVVSADADSCKITAPEMTHEYRIAAGVRTDITWTLKGAQGFEFTTDGILFKREVPAGIFAARQAASKQQFVHAVDNSTPNKSGKHRYNIEVQKGSVTCRLDPTVVND